MEQVDRPLKGVRVVDAVQGPLASITRYLVELGARVDRIVPPDPRADRFEDIAANVGKALHDVAPHDRAALLLIEAADLIVADPGQGIDLGALVAARPRLVAMTASGFGTGNSLSDWKATGPVLHALSGELARSGIRGREPLLPPGDLAWQCAASQAAYTLVAALYRAFTTGLGDHIDFSALDGTVQALDPGFGISGSATMGKPADLLSRGRPAAGVQYPILPCADGHVRICLLARRQWQGMFRWMGEPAQFASPEFEKMAVRYKSPELLPAIRAFFANQTRAQLEAGARQHGVPLSALLAFEECIATEHMRVREAIVEISDGEQTLKLPNGSMIVDGGRMGAAQPSQAAHFPITAPSKPASTRPFEGLKVLDMGVIVVGAEQGRLLADQGADVIKVESRDYPDGSRQSYLDYGMSVSFAAGHRNKRSLGINLRDPEGRALFLRLAAEADVILSNFKPGTLQGLGLDYERVSAINPRIVMTDSSAFGSTGPWSGRMGYGPLVRAATGLTLAWRYGGDPEGFSDSVTIYPDHVAARVGAMATLALLIRRLRSGRGGTVSIAQSEVMLTHFAADVARVSAGVAAGGVPDWPWGVYPAAGDDEWCVVTIRGDAQWRALCGVIGFDGLAYVGAEARRAEQAVINAAISAWTGTRSREEAARLLQAAGVAAAPMLRLADLPDHPYYRDRAFFRTEEHPYLRERVVAERRHARSASIEDALARPAPLAGEQSTEILSDWLKLDTAQIAPFLERAVIEPASPKETAAAAKARAAMP
jgi:crotonobetainyl-CoA:carnitine CoA-transferase CaiB-like acyl-CoA transferase